MLLYFWQSLSLFQPPPKNTFLFPVTCLLDKDFASGPAGYLVLEKGRTQGGCLSCFLLALLQSQDRQVEPSRSGRNACKVGAEWGLFQGCGEETVPVVPSYFWWMELVLAAARIPDLESLCGMWRHKCLWHCRKGSIFCLAVFCLQRCLKPHKE